MKSHAIRKARVPRRLSHPRATRALEHWLAEADPARHGLPARAIVLVRRLQAPWTALASPETGTRYRTFASALAGAARPARGELHGDVVWFADEAELLACLARAALAGDLALHWWWRLVLRGLAPEVARTRWVELVRAVPRAAAQMEAAETRRWLGSWPAGEQRRLVQELARVFPVAEEVVLEEMALAQRATADASDSASLTDLLSTAPVAALVPPGEGLRRLLLALAREPMAASEGQRVRALLHGAVHAGASVRAAPASRVQAKQATTPAWTDPRVAAVAGSEAHAWIEAEGAQAAASSLPAPPTPTLAASTTHAPPAAISVDEAETADMAAGEPAAEPPWTEIQSPAFLHTEFGGLLFLLNAALQLGLYGDFTQPLRPRTLACSPWRFLLASGRLYAGRAFADDPLAAWLRERAPQRAPGERTRHPGLWRGLRERLALALALDDPQQLVSALLRLPARIEDGGERVDLHMDLATLPLPVRLAGLDRDPGWIPAAACDVRFHFH